MHLFLFSFVIVLFNNYIVLAEDLIKRYRAVSDTSSKPIQTICVEPGYKLICGGARVEYNGKGNLLTGSYPIYNDKGEYCWKAMAKDHLYSDKAVLYVFATAIYDPDDKIDIKIWKHVGKKSNIAMSEVGVENGYTVLCGGSKSNYDDDDDGAGSFLTASYQNSRNQWRSEAKDRKIRDSTTIESFVIGAKLKNGDRFEDKYEIRKHIGISLPKSNPSVTIIGDSNDHGWYTYGGGGYIHWNKYGNFLYAIYPARYLDRYICEGKDHGDKDESVLECFAFSIRKKT